MKRWIARLLVLATLLLPQTVVFAQQSTLLPEPSGSLEVDTQIFEGLSEEQKQELADKGIYTACEYSFDEKGIVFESSIYYKSTTSQDDRQDILYCAIQSGKVHLWMIPYFISYFANFFIGLSGVISVLFVLLGGFWYMTGGLTDDKEKGKKTITYALGGMVLTLLAWLIVNIIQVQVTR